MPSNNNWWGDGRGPAPSAGWRREARAVKAAHLAAASLAITGNGEVPEFETFDLVQCSGTEGKEKGLCSITSVSCPMRRRR